MQDNERIANMEVRVGHLEDSANETRAALRQLATDMHKLAVAAAERQQDREALARIFQHVERLRGEHGAMWDHMREIEQTHNDHVQKQLENELREKNKQIEDEKNRKRAIIWTLLKEGMLITVALVLYHFGVKMVG